MPTYLLWVVGGFFMLWLALFFVRRWLGELDRQRVHRESLLPPADDEPDVRVDLDSKTNGKTP